MSFPPDKFWVTYKVITNGPDVLSRPVQMRTGYLETLEAAKAVTDKLRPFKHVSGMTIERISTVWED